MADVHQTPQATQSQLLVLSARMDPPNVELSPTDVIKVCLGSCLRGTLGGLVGASYFSTSRGTGNMIPTEMWAHGMPNSLEWFGMVWKSCGRQSMSGERLESVARHVLFSGGT